MMTEGSAEKAVIAAGYKSDNPATVNVTASKLMRVPQIVREIDRLLSERYPDHDADFAQLLRQQMQKALAGELQAKDALALLEFHSKVKGYLAPTQSQHLKATLKLPSE